MYISALRRNIGAIENTNPHTVCSVSLLYLSLAVFNLAFGTTLSSTVQDKKGWAQLDFFMDKKP